MTPSISRTAIRKNAIVVNIAATPLAVSLADILLHFAAMKKGEPHSQR